MYSFAFHSLVNEHESLLLTFLLSLLSVLRFRALTEQPGNVLTVNIKNTLGTDDLFCRLINFFILLFILFGKKRYLMRFNRLLEEIGWGVCGVNFH